MDNYYDEESSNNEYELAVFVRNEDGTFDRFEEEHYQHGFTLGEVADAVKKRDLKSGMYMMHFHIMYLMIIPKGCII